MKVKGWHEGVGGMCKGEWIVYEGDGKVCEGDDWWCEKVKGGGGG